jgi:hypothetical protein
MIGANENIMNYDEYKKDRVCDQIDWYNRKSGKNRKVFQALRTIQIIAGALIPFLSGLILGINAQWQTYSTIIVGALGVIVTIATGLSTLGRYRENWVEYRKMSENLQREMFLYETEAGRYSAKNKNRFDIFVQTVESLLASENSNWSQIMLKPEKPEDAQSEKK